MGYNIRVVWQRSLGFHQGLRVPKFWGFRAQRGARSRRDNIPRANSSHFLKPYVVGRDFDNETNKIRYCRKQDPDSYSSEKLVCRV